MSETILNAINLNRFYKTGGHTLHVLKDVSFKIEKGVTVSIVGPSGSGKSTLLGLAAGLDERHRRIVIDRLGEHRTDDTDLVRDGSDVGNQLAHLGAGGTVPIEFEDAGCNRKARLSAGHRRQALTFADRIG